MSQDVQTYAPGTRVKTVKGEIPLTDFHAGDTGTVVETSTHGGDWIIWVLWDAWEADPQRRGYTIAYSLHQLEVAE